MLVGVGLAVAAAALAADRLWFAAPADDAEEADAPSDEAPLPLPPLPPRIAQGERYDRCLAMVADDPHGVEDFVTAWDPAHSDDGARQCEALAQIALGDPAGGAQSLQALAQSGHGPGIARAVLYDQAAQAWLMAGQPARAMPASDAALGLSPGEPDLLMTHATIAVAMEHWQRAADDLSAVLGADPNRPDALVLRAAAWRHLGQLDDAEDDVDRALALDDANPEALLQRGILRQRRNDKDGARADWQRAIDLAPDSEAADLAQQDLALLEAGPADH